MQLLSVLSAIVGLTAASASTFELSQVHQKLEPVRDVEGSPLCKTCVNIGSQGIQTLLNYILNAGVVGGCSKLCGALPKKTEQEICQIACTIVGIQGFVKAIQKVDLDPIYLCEEIKLCPAGPDDAAETINTVTVSPASGAVGQTTFNFEVDFSVVNATGVGEIGFSLQGPGQQVGQSFLNVGYSPGTYGAKVSFQPKNDPNANPPVNWFPGTYNYTFTLCQGECGSKHPHSKVFGSKTGSFEITQ